MSVVVRQIQSISVVLTQFQTLMAAIVVPADKIYGVSKVISLYKSPPGVFFIIFPGFVSGLGIAIGT